MIKLLKWLIPLGTAAVLVLIQACGPLKPNSQDACNFVQNSNGERISWKGNLPIPLRVHESFPPNYLSSLYEAVQIWETSVGRRLFDIVSVREAGPILPRQDRISMIYWMNTWESDRTSEQGRTSIYWVGNAIQEADIRINAKDFSYYLDTPSASKSNEVQLTSLLVHELGHVLGLKHDDAEPSVMATYLSVHTSRKALTSTDSTSVQCEY